MKPISAADFIKKAKYYFRFLEDQFGFKIVSARSIGDAAEVLWASPKIYVSVNLLPPQFDSQLQFGRIGLDDQPGAFSFEPGDLIQLDTCTGWVWRPGPDDADTNLAEYARLLKQCGDDCLVGNEKVFEGMKTAREILVKQWKRDEEQGSSRIRAEQAWAQRNYKEVTRVYESMVLLTDLERKRLSFAKKHLE